MKRSISIIGGGPCALMLGCELNTALYNVTIYERNNAPARKFLVAGEGGLNLTHSEPAAAFIKRYTPSAFLEPAFAQFSNTDLIAWLHALGIDTYVGSSGRVFPRRGIKPVEALTTILNKIKQNGTDVKTKHVWKGFAADGGLLMEHEGSTKTIYSDLVIFCLGGASWPVTGSKGDWVEQFKSRGIAVNPFAASNCAFRIDWPAELSTAIEGQAVKNCAIRCGAKTQPGEVVLTRTGVEGSGIYPLSPEIRNQIALQGQAVIHIDLKPLVPAEALLQKLQKPKGKATYSKHLATRLNLSPVQLSLLRHSLSKAAFMDEEQVVAGIKDLPLIIKGLGPIEDAISTVGGIALEEINERFELKKLPRHFAIGEMLDFDAPTGGYLLQAAFSMGKSLAMFLNGLKH